MLNNLLNEYYVSIFGLQIYDFYFTDKIKSCFFSMETDIFFALMPNNDRIRLSPSNELLNFQQKQR